MAAATLPDLITDAQSTEESFLRQIFVRDQMAEWSKHPLVMAKAEGVYYWDVAGKRYLDGISGIYVASVGHNNRRVIDAITAQYERARVLAANARHQPAGGATGQPAGGARPEDLSTVKFQTGGSEVTEAAIKLARQYHKLTGSPGKYKIISRYQSWHGSTLGALSASGLKSRRTVNEPLAPGFLHVFPPTCYRCPFGKSYPECGITCATIVESVVEMEDPSTVAAIMVEPIGHTGGVIDPPDEYLPILREICDRHNILLIFDEIITGIGRTGRMFAAETFGVTPDVLCIAKGMSGGYAPISAMICRERISRAFWGPIAENPGFVEGHTFEGNPISCAAGLAVLGEIIERDLCGNARAQGARLRQRFEGLAQKYPEIGDIRGKGLFQAIELVKDRATKARFPDSLAVGVKVGRRALEHGLLCRFDPHWIAFGPPLVVRAEEIDDMVAILDLSLGEILSEVGNAGNGDQPEAMIARRI